MMQNDHNDDNHSSPSNSSSTKKPIVLTGFSLRGPKSSSVQEFAEALKAGEDLTTANTRYPDGHLGLPPRQGLIKKVDIEGRFNESFFGLNHIQAEAMDPSLRMLLQVSYEALMDAQLDVHGMRGSKTGVYVAHSFSDTLAYLSGPSNSKKKTGYEVVNGYHCMLSNRLSYFYDFKGPSQTIDTGCSSSIVALDRAVQDIEAGNIDYAVVAGANLTLDPSRVSAFNALKALSPTGRCYSYDTRANGYCRSEGIACIVLEVGTKGYARIGGIGNNSDGATAQGITYPSAQSQMELMLGVFKKSMIDPKTISYHEGHGTGTVAGDREELNALSKVYSHNIHIGSVKSNMGHTEPASGLFGIIKILLMYEDQMLYPNYDWKESNHDAILDGTISVVHSCQNWKKGACTLSSFGLGGSNAFMILLPTTRKSSTLSLLNGSSVTPMVRPFLSSLPESSTNSSSTMTNLYGKYYCIQRQLSNSDPFQYEQVEGKWTKKSPLVFVLGGQGSQWNTMGQDLMKTNAVFRAAIERLENKSGIPLVDLYEDGTKWMDKTKTVIGIVSFQLGLIAVLASHGIAPDYFLGHSLGEIACSFLGGLQTEAEVMDVAKFRASLTTLIETNSRLDVYPKSESNHDEQKASYIFSTQHNIQKSDLSSPMDPNVVRSFSMRGTMVVVGCDAETLEGMIDRMGLEQTCVACYNSPKGQTISGPTVEVNQLLEEVKKANPATFIRTLSTDNVAYHAPYMEVFRDHLSQEFTNKFGSIESQPLPSSWKSTSGSKTFGVDYIVNNICGRVYFQKAIESLPRSSTVIEIGPSSSLLSQIKRIRTDLTLVQFVERNTPVDLESVLNTLKPQFSSSMESKEQTSFLELDSTKPLSYKERYPDLWGKQTVFKLPSWQDYSGKVEGASALESSTAQTVHYNLRKAPWSSILDHNIRGQILFPVAGFLHALWSSQRFKKGTELINMKVQTPLLISSSDKDVNLYIYQTGDYCEVRGMDNVCHVTAYVKQVLPTTAQIKPPEESNVVNEDGFESKHFYSHVRRMGYNYGQSYQLLDDVTPSQARFGKKPQDWICYLDACLHLALHNTKSFFYPTGFSRVIFWRERLHKASMWIKKKSGDSFGNETILLEGIQKEFALSVSQSISTYSEKFIRYHESDQKEDPSAIASLLFRELTAFHVVEPILSASLAEVVKELQNISPAEERKSKEYTDLVISDRIYHDANLLLTTSVDNDQSFQEFPNHVVARWGDICLLRRRSRDDEPVVEPTIVTDWKDVPKSSDPFVWYGDGASGAVKCLHDEKKDRKAISYEGGSIDNLIGLEKSMRHNYIRDGVHHGCWVDVKDKNEEEDDNQKYQTSYAKLQIGRPGLLDSLEWHGLDVDADNCDVEIRASGLNFRDVMRAMGQLKEDDMRLGLEYSGVNVHTKERVFGFGSQTLATHARAYYSFPTPKDMDLSDDQAATIPVVYITVYYALLEKANIRKGQSILIHAGAGGVGIAAITVARSRGLKIFTTCSSQKREFLKTKFGLEDHQIGDSRSDDFVNTVLRGTNQRGVDVVLNQLAGELQVASMRCLAPGGHFCEIGKYDVMRNTAISLGLMANNISFHVIDLLPMFKDPANKAMFDKFLSDGFERNEIVPLPITTYNAKDVVEAFRYMSQGRHIGKVIINGFGSYNFPVKEKAVSMQGETHLITGGLGGVGLALAHKLASLKCREVILISRRGVTNSYQRKQIAEMEAMHCKVQVVKCDVADLTPSLASPDCIWHIATVYKDVVFDKMTPEDWEYVRKPKVDGYTQLRKCWPSVQIIATTSITAYYGGGHIHGQTSYALSNAFLDQAARKDANTLSVRLGPIDDVGYFTGADLNRKIVDMGSYITMKIDCVLDKLLKISRQHQNGVFGIYSFKERDSSRGNGQARKDDKVYSAYCLKDAQNLMAIVMGGKPSQYYNNLKLNDAGLDSLSKMEVVHHIHEMSGSKSFKPSDIDDSFVVEDIVSAIVSTIDDTSGGLNNNQIAEDKDASEITDETSQESEESSSEEEFDAYVENKIKRGHQLHQDEHDNSVVQKNTSSLQYSYNVEKSSTSVQDFIGINSVKDANQSLFLTVEVGPHSIDFESVISALASTKFIIFRQSDPIIFNHGAPLDSEKDASVATFMDQYVALAQALSASKAIIMVIIEGEVRGGGMIFPALADICIATPKSSFGLPEIHRGMVPAVVSQALKERLGNITTRRLALTGERISADKALQISLIDSIVEESELEHHLEGILRRWEPRVSAAQFIKHNLLPTNSNSGLMRVGGTRAGEWFNAQRQLKLDDREVLRVSLIDGVATLTMCDEVTFNSASYEMSRAILAITPRLREEARVIILQSSFKNFHLGLQSSVARKFRGRPVHEAAAIVKSMFQGFVDLAQLGIPIIGVLNGKIFGGGVPVALWCDYRIVTSDVDIHVGNISRGVSPCGQLSNLLNEYFPRAEVMRHYLGNHHWYAKDLLRLGIVDHIKKTQSDAMKEAQALAKFIAQQPARGVRDSMHILKVSHAPELIDEEAWFMASKATQTDDCFSKKDHGSFQYDDEGGNVPLEDYQLSVPAPHQLRGSDSGAAVGIIAMEVYVPHYCIDADVLEENHIPARTKNGQDAVAVWDGSEDVISMALNAVSMLLEKHVKDPRMIGRIEVGTESNVDMSKSIKSYIMDLLPEDHKNVEGVDNTNACYGGAAAMINTLSWCRESGGRYGIVVATDTADMDLMDSSWRGASAVAILIGPNPWIEIHPERASCFKNSSDFVKPRYSHRKSPFVQGKTSVQNYINALDFTVKEFRKLHSVDPSSFDTLVYHGGLSISFQKFIEKHLLRNVCSRRTCRATFEMMRNFGSKMGGLYTASMFVQLLSLLDSYNNLDGDESKLLPPLNHIGLFAYGSGSTATLFHAKIHHERRHEINLGIKLKMREKVTFEVLSAICKGATGIDLTLPRLNGRFYFDVSKKDQIIREYFKEGTSKRLAPESPEPYMVSASDKEAITPRAHVQPGEDDGLNVGGRSNNHDEEESWARTKVMMSFVAGIIWWISVAVAYDPRLTLVDNLRTVVFTLMTCSVIHFVIHRQSSHDGSRIFHSLSCSHFVQATIMYITYIVLYTISPASFHKHWIYITLAWVTYISGAMIASKEAWESIDHNQRVFWIIHHNLSFFFLAMHPLISQDSWDEVSIKSCYLFLVAQIWNSSLNIYRNVYGNGGGSFSLTQKQIIFMRTFATLVEKTQQIYAASLQFFLGGSSKGDGIFWTPVLIMFVMITIELSFQVSALYRPLRKALQSGCYDKLD